MQTYLELMRQIRTHGHHKADRTGVGTLSIFGCQMRFDLSAGFPLVTTKKMFWPGIVYELLWFLRGDTNVRWLNERGVSGPIRPATLGRYMAISGGPGRRRMGDT